MAGFQKSPEFEQAVDTLMQMAEIEGLRNGYAVLDADLKVVDWHKDEWSADEHIGCGTCKARVPDLDGRFYGEAALLAGLTYTLVSDRHMAEFEFEEPTDISAWAEGQSRVEYHLFGPEQAEVKA